MQVRERGRPPALTFWFDFASTYAYLTAMRIEACASRAGVAVRYRPFLLGPIFAAQGWSTSPFNLYPAKGRYMVRDISRIAASRGLAFRLPEPFPAHSVAAARAALVADDAGRAAPFVQTIFKAEFGEGADIADARTIADVARSAGLDPAAVAEGSADPAIKLRLRQFTAQAQQIGIFGAPMFETDDGELFWGDDRLEQALEWAVAHRSHSRSDERHQGD